VSWGSFWLWAKNWNILAWRQTLALKAIADAETGGLKVRSCASRMQMMVQHPRDGGFLLCLFLGTAVATHCFSPRVSTGTTPRRKSFGRHILLWMKDD